MAHRHRRAVTAGTVVLRHRTVPGRGLGGSSASLSTPCGDWAARLGAHAASGATGRSACAVPNAERATGTARLPDHLPGQVRPRLPQDPPERKPTDGAVRRSTVHLLARGGLRRHPVGVAAAPGVHPRRAGRRPRARGRPRRLHRRAVHHQDGGHDRADRRGLHHPPGRLRPAQAARQAAGRQARPDLALPRARSSRPHHRRPAHHPRPGDRAAAGWRPHPAAGPPTGHLDPDRPRPRGSARRHATCSRTSASPPHQPPHRERIVDRPSASGLLVGRGGRSGLRPPWSRTGRRTATSAHSN